MDYNKTLLGHGESAINGGARYSLRSARNSQAIRSSTPAGPEGAVIGTLDLGDPIAIVQPASLSPVDSQATSQGSARRSQASHRLVTEASGTVLIYEGKFQSFICLCGVNCRSLRLLERHLLGCASNSSQSNLGDRSIKGFRCSKCSENQASLIGAAHHFRVCSNLRSPQESAAGESDGSSSPQEPSFDCNYCDKSFNSSRGLGSHKRHRHPATLHEDGPKRKKARWAPTEDDALIEAEAEVRLRDGWGEGGLRSSALNEAVYGQLKSSLPDFDRSLESVMARRTRPSSFELEVQSRIQVLNASQMVNEPELADQLDQLDVQYEMDAEGTCECNRDLELTIEAHLQELGRDPELSRRHEFLRRVKESLEGYNTRDFKQSMGLIPEGGRSQTLATVADSQHRRERGSNGRKKVSDRANIRRIYETQGPKRCLQHLRNPTKAGKCSLDTVNLFKSVFEDEGALDEAAVAIKKSRRDSHLIHRPVSDAEVEHQLARLKKGTAPGLDGLRTGDLGEVNSGDLACLFNIFLLKEDVPSPLKENKTTMIPKSQDPGVGDWRPITLSSILDRLFAKVLEARLSQVVELNASQRGFIKSLDGCGENLTTYQGLMRYARTNAKSLIVVSLDLAKAFDSVKYSSIRRGLTRLGLDGVSIGLLMNLCYGHKTSIAYDGGDAAVELRRGVRQGWPLSPLLFLIVVDELLCSLKPVDGFPIVSRTGERTGVTGAAFADDLILYSGSVLGIKRSIDSAISWCDDRGMKVNANKSSVTWLEAVPGKKKVVVAPIDLPVKGVLIPNIGETYERVLGVHMHYSGRVDHKVDKFEADLDLVCKSDLRLSQKASMIRDCLIPMIKYRLVYGFAKSTACQQIDRLLRVRLRKTLHLPKFTADLYFYVARKDGGLGIPRLAESVLLAQVKLADRMAGSKNQTTRILADDKINVTATDRFSRFLDNGAMTSGRVESTKRLLQEERFQAFKNSTQGAGWDVFRGAPRKFLDKPRERGWKEHDMVDALKLRLDVWMTRAVAARTIARHGIQTVCRGCHLKLETLGHVIGQCSVTQADRVARHDSLCSYIEKRLKENLGSRATDDSEVSVHREYQVVLTAGSESGTSQDVCLRPDLVVITPCQIFILEVSVVFEYSGQNQRENALERVRREKCLKYERLRKVLSSRFRRHCEVRTLIVGCRGGWLKSNDKLLTGIAGSLSEMDKNSLVERAVRGSLISLKRFFNNTREKLIDNVQ